MNNDVLMSGMAAKKKEEPEDPRFTNGLPDLPGPLEPEEGMLPEAPEAKPDPNEAIAAKDAPQAPFADVDKGREKY